MRIKNKHYRQFLDQGEIRTIEESDIFKALENIKAPRIQEKRACLICMYYTGGRPVEILNIKGIDIKKESVYIQIKVPASKRGLPRIVWLPYKKPLVKEFYNFAMTVYPDMPLFFHLRSHYVRSRQTKKGEVTSVEITDSLRYHIKQWFTGIIEDSIPPYFLRHNRFSKLALAGVSLQDIRMIKGSKTMDSVMPYLHMSAYTAKKVSKKMD